MRSFQFLPLLLFVVACSPYHSVLDSLGESSSFADVEIGENFPAPEDEVIEDDLEDGSGEIVEIKPITEKAEFAFDSGTFKLANGDALRWDGCVTDQATRGGYNSDTNCGRAFFHPAFADNLNKAFYICVADAAKVAGYPDPVRVFIKHLGSYNDRNARGSSRKSNHAFARAWDLVNFNMFDADGNLHRVSTLLRDYKGAQAKFYDEFRDCWAESLPTSCRPGNTEYLGSIGHRSSKLGGNTLHNDHIHLSYPLCAGSV